MRHIGLHWWIFLGILVGLAAGTLLHQMYYDELSSQARVDVLGERFTPEQETAAAREIQSRLDQLLRGTFWGGMVDGIAAIFMNLLRMIVIPLVVASLITGVAGLGDPKRLGRLGGKALGWYMMTSLLAILTGLVLVNLLRPGVGVEMPIPVEAATIEPPGSVWEVLLNMIPANVFRAAAEFDLFPLIFFSILFGIFTLLVPEPVASPVIGFFRGLFEIMMRMTMFIIALAPIGIAAMIARLVAVTGPEVFLSLFGYVGTVAAALAVHFFLTIPLLFWLITRRNPYSVMRVMSPALLTAFSTASSAGTLPLTIERAERGVGISNKVSGFVLPLGATVNMDGTALYECVAVIFVAQLYATMTGFELTLAHQATIVILALMVSIGAAGIPHAGLVMMVIIFQAVGLPLELIGLLWAVDRVLDMCRTTVNIWSDAMGAATIAHTEGEIDETVLFRPARPAPELVEAEV